MRLVDYVTKVSDGKTTKKPWKDKDVTGGNKLWSVCNSSVILMYKRFVIELTSRSYLSVCVCFFL
jgi:hypothetical protein